MTFWLGVAMFGCAMFGFGVLATMAYVGSLGWEFAEDVQPLDGQSWPPQV